MAAKKRKPKKKKQPKKKPIVLKGGRKAPTLPGDMADRFRGSNGRHLSKAEAKEQPLPKITVECQAPSKQAAEPRVVTPEKAVERHREAQPCGMESSHGVNEPKVSLNRETQPYGMGSSHRGVKDPRVSLKREPQPYGMESNHGADDPAVVWKRESQPYRMESTHGDINKNDPPVALKRESQPYSMVAQPTPEPECVSSDDEDDVDEFYEDEDSGPYDYEEYPPEMEEDPWDLPVENEPPEEQKERAEPKPKRASVVFNKMRKRMSQGAKVAAKGATKGAKIAARRASKGAATAADKAGKDAKVAAAGASKGAKIAGRGARKGAAVAANKAGNCALPKLCRSLWLWSCCHYQVESRH